MQHSKYNELKEAVQSLNQKLLAISRFQKSILTMMKDVDHRVDATRELCVSADVFSAEAFDEITDRMRGLRLKNDGEQIEAGDIVWVNYKATIGDNEHTYGEEGMPVRVGSGAVVFEQSLIGHFPKENGIVHEDTFKAGQMAGKKVVFTLDVIKVKTRVDQGDDLDGEFQFADDTNGSQRDELRADAGGSEPDVVVNGQGHQESGDHTDQRVLDQSI